MCWRTSSGSVSANRNGGQQVTASCDNQCHEERVEVRPAGGLELGTGELVDGGPGVADSRKLQETLMSKGLQRSQWYLT
jgi:hypothetical protein